MEFKLEVLNYEELKKVENFLFRFIFPEPFSLYITVLETFERFYYSTEYNSLAQGLVLETL